jgi:hypothetical protein
MTNRVLPLAVRFTPFDPKLPFTTTLADGRVGWIADIRSGRRNNASVLGAATRK